MRFFALILALFVLAGCGSEPHGAAAETVTHYRLTFPANPGGRMCTTQCGAAKDYCHQSCDLAHRQCVVDVQASAVKDYDAYIRQQHARGEAIELRPRDFERIRGCETTYQSCGEDCDSEHRLCFGNCGGKVEQEAN